MKLTIGIPTYNGASRIKDTLDSILIQFNHNICDKVDILISDNGSTDETKSIVDQYKKKSNIKLSYIRHESNIGFDKNVDSLFHHASGDYVWTLADDDTLRPNALRRVIQSLEQDSLNVILVNFIAFDKDMKYVQDVVPLSHDSVYRNPEDFLKSAKSKYSLVSSLIFRRKSWLGISINPGIGSNFIHVYSLFSILPQGASKIISEPLINYRKDSENFGTSTQSVLNISFSAGRVILLMKNLGYKNTIINWLLHETEDYIHRLVIKLKIEGLNNRDEVVKNLLEIYPTPKTIIKIIPILYIPDKLFKNIYYFRNKISQKLKIIEAKIFNK